MIPRFLEGIIERKGKERKPNEKESGNVSVVENGHRTCEETFTGSKVVFKDGQGLVHLVLSDEMHGELFDSQRQIEEGAVGAVGSIQNGLGLLGFQTLEELCLEVLLVFPFGREVALHGSDKGPCAFGETVQISISLLGGGLRVVIE